MFLLHSSCAGRTTNHVLRWLFLASACCSLALSVCGQSEPSERKRRVASEGQVNADLKLLLNDYYAGKPVRAKVVIPANERGVEVMDGQLKMYPLPELTAAVQPGELVLIKELRFKAKEIEVRFDGEHLKEAATFAPSAGLPGIAPVGPHGSDATTGPPPAALVAKAPKPPKPLPDPRIVLRFSRDIETRDLNLQSINRLLAPAVDVATLLPTAAVKPEAALPPRPSVSEQAQRAAVEQGIAVAPVTGTLVGAAANVGELVIECPVTNARLYIDGTYSGTAPRTVQLLMGIHTILVTSSQGQFEQKFFLSPGKIATIKVEFNPK